MSINRASVILHATVQELRKQAALEKRKAVLAYSVSGDGTRKIGISVGGRFLLMTPSEARAAAGALHRAAFGLKALRVSGRKSAAACCADPAPKVWVLTDKDRRELGALVHGKSARPQPRRA